MKETVSKIMTEVLKDSLKVGFTCNLQISDLNNRFPEKESIFVGVGLCIRLKDSVILKAKRLLKSSTLFLEVLTLKLLIE